MTESEDATSMHCSSSKDEGRAETLLMWDWGAGRAKGDYKGVCKDQRLHNTSTVVPRSVLFISSASNPQETFRFFFPTLVFFLIVLTFHQIVTQNSFLLHVSVCLTLVSHWRMSDSGLITCHLFSFSFHNFPSEKGRGSSSEHGLLSLKQIANTRDCK